MLSLVVTFTPAFVSARAYTSASTSFSGKLAEPMTTEPDELPPLSGLDPPEEDEAEDDAVPEAPGLALLGHAATAARPRTANAAIPLFAAILTVICFPSLLLLLINPDRPSSASSGRRWCSPLCP